MNKQDGATYLECQAEVKNAFFLSEGSHWQAIYATVVGYRDIKCLFNYYSNNTTDVVPAGTYTVFATVRRNVSFGGRFKSMYYTLGGRRKRRMRTTSVEIAWQHNKGVLSPFVVDVLFTFFPQLDPLPTHIHSSPRLIVAGHVTYVEPEENSFTIMAPQTIDRGSIFDGFTIHATVDPTRTQTRQMLQLPEEHTLVMITGLLQNLRNTHATIYVDSINPLNCHRDCIHHSFMRLKNPSGIESQSQKRVGETIDTFFARLFQTERDFLAAE